MFVAHCVLLAINAVVSESARVSELSHVSEQPGPMPSTSGHIVSGTSAIECV